MIPATIRITDTDLTPTRFDAQPYFEKAEDADLEALDDDGYESSDEADSVAVGSDDPKVKTLLAYITDQDAAFEVKVDPQAARAWIKANRPDVITLTDEQIDAAQEATGNDDLDAGQIREALRRIDQPNDLETALAAAEAQFDAQGGRGVELADLIDAYRIALAIQG